MTDKHYITAQQLLDDSYRLGLAIIDSGYVPDLIIGLWRGGAPIAIVIQELLAYLGHSAEHIPLRTSLYRGIEKRASSVCIEGLENFAALTTTSHRILLVDDVFDTGLTAQAVVARLRKHYQPGTEIRVATPWFKPDNNQTGSTPDYFLHQTSAWLVFPHELCGLSAEEVAQNKPGIDAIRARLA